ncbi:BQ5605_C015g07984 [Microbotryum silenes-dioicae]|uniref:BQ5605_C015g07984 protein n=1 Tax=Microbotryum silenes-dioicae TaxID=796604 RepID=A0A2X0MN30_9BASI|nr:BQ5605_C015g07984 [Microbotryum silenes-dioicae]
MRLQSSQSWLNIPYDCGIFFSRSSGLYELLGPGQNSSAYLRSTQVSVPSSPTETTTPLLDPYRTMTSPIFLDVENYRRFRALPVYTALKSLGTSGYAELFASNIAFAHRVASYLDSNPAFDVLTPSSRSPGSKLRFRQLNIVLFAYVQNAEINNTGRMYCTGTKWKGRGAIPIAVSNWSTNEERVWAIVREVFDKVSEEATE